MYGYAGKILFVDLATGSIRAETLDGDTCRKWVGCAGLGARVLLEHTPANFDPLGPESMLGFTTGPFVATGVYGGGRFMVVGKSPLTRSWADSSAGGNFGPELKLAGYDAVFVTGSASQPVCLVIDDGDVSLVSAEDLWGKDTYETDEQLQAKLGGERRWVVACIGPAGEKRSLLAGIVTDKGRGAARSGLGAVMGAKKLKAVAVRARRGARVPVADKAGLRAVLKDYLAELRRSPFHQSLTKAGTGASTSTLLRIGDCPADNWRRTGVDALPGATNLDSANMDVYKLRSYACHSCPIACGALLRVTEGPFATRDEVHRPEYETLAAFGPLCHNDNVLAVVRANEICNRYGLDTIGVGNAVAFAMECFEQGLITACDTGGLCLNWGDATAIVALTEQIAKREGFGALLADGSQAAAERIGGRAQELAMHVGGRAVPYHDPRLAPSSGVFYISDAQPAQHMGPQGMAVLEQGGSLGADPLLQPGDVGELYGDWERKGEIYARGAAYMQLLTATGLCALYAQFYTPPVVELLRPVTGWDIDWREGLDTGRRILTARQAFNVREGVKPGDFRLPERLTLPMSLGPARGKTIPFERLRAYYFEALGWDPETGEPRPETLARLGIEHTF
ncbi:MAG: aldehyde ferredoxin oxidoreductase family protein [Thermoleophilia bacterium]|nr:aldehyde ferredoxin oxidoreductase family protein [Thermoleophilia bacterium]